MNADGQPSAVNPDHHPLLNITTWYPGDPLTFHCWAALRTDADYGFDLHIACSRWFIPPAIDKPQLCGCDCHLGWSLLKYDPQPEAYSPPS